MDLALNNPERLICHKTKQPTNQPTNQSITLSMEFRICMSYLIQRGKTVLQKKCVGYGTKL